MSRLIVGDGLLEGGGRERLRRVAIEQGSGLKVKPAPPLVGCNGAPAA